MSFTFGFGERARALLVLGRVSNLPTVWSNCLAAWMLAGAALQPGVLLLCSGATLLYLGGMFLNDAFDEDFDRKYRPERPIISGQIGARKVWQLGLVWLGLGCLAILPFGTPAAALALVLVAAIVCYDALHKRTILAPLIMASCRFLLYVVAAAAAGGISVASYERVLALTAYITGLGYLARAESSGRYPLWPQPLLVAPVVVAMFAGDLGKPMAWISLVSFGVWVPWCLRGMHARKARILSSGVSGLLAGIALVDWLALSSVAPGRGWIFLLLFVSALLLQRVVPAT